MEKNQIVSNKQIKLEIEMILNRKLFQDKVINRETYEIVQDELLREIMKEKEKYWKSINNFFVSICTYKGNNYIMIEPIKILKTHKVISNVCKRKEIKKYGFI